MKKWLALSLTVVSGLSALEANNEITGALRPPRSQNQMNKDCCTPCEPCCVPKPKKCIDCECYVPPYYDLQCDWGFFGYADFLYWYANEGNLSYAMVVQGVEQPFDVNIFVPKTTKHLGTNWDPGFRLGLGWNTGNDGWDLDLNWTWYHNKKSNSVSVDPFSTDGTLFFPLPGQSAILNPWNSGGFSATAAGIVHPFLYENVQANWNLLLNSIDLDLGRKYWLSRRFTMRPYAGGRGSWARTVFRVHGTGSTTVNIVESTDRFKDNFWGVGLLGGFQPEWFMTPNFTLFANIDTALLWGQFKIRKAENYNQLNQGIPFISIENRFHSNFSKMQAMLDLAFGFRWTKTWCLDRYRSSFDAGWEHHIWFDTNNRFKTNGIFRAPGETTAIKGFTGYDELVGNLMYGGLVVRARFDF